MPSGNSRSGVVLEGGDGSPSLGTHVPVEAGLWVLIFGEMLVFAMLFLTYVYYRDQEPELFRSSQRTLHQWNGAMLTVVLVTGSLLVVMAVQAAREGLRRSAQRKLLGAIVCGLAFSALKSLEYVDKFQHGTTPETNTFYMLYFVLTGLHWFHLILGMIALAVLYRMLGNSRHDQPLAFVEGGAAYWHMVDLVWVILFPLLYLVR